MDNYIQGESIELAITINDENGTIIDLDTLLTISISVYNRDTNVVLKAGTKADGDITYDSVASTGIIKFYIEDGLTSLANTGVYSYILSVTQFDSGFDDNTDTGKYTENAFTLK